MQDIREAQTEIAGAQREGSTGPVPVPGAAMAGRRVRILATTLLAAVALGAGAAAIPSLRARIHTWPCGGALPPEKTMAVPPIQGRCRCASPKATPHRR